MIKPMSPKDIEISNTEEEITLMQVKLMQQKKKMVDQNLTATEPYMVLVKELD
jgi:hypothetical protein